MLKLLNNFTKPVLFVAVLVLLVAYFSDAIVSMNVITQFVLVGLPLSFIIFYYFGKLHDGWHYVIALFLTALAWDLVMPPYQVDLTGTINTSTFLSGTATDTFFGTIWHSIGFNGFSLFVMTYVVTFAVLFGVAIFVLKLGKKTSEAK